MACERQGAAAVVAFGIAVASTPGVDATTLRQEIERLRRDLDDLERRAR